MDLNKSREFFDPEKIKHPCHVIGCGAIGSSVAELLVRQGIQKLHLWDFDKVESHNIVNQMFTAEDIHAEKTTALETLLKKINPDCRIETHGKYTDQALNGYIFMCTDTVESRKDILENNKYNQQITAVFDFRMTLLEGQHYATTWNDHKTKTSLLKSLDFTHEEAKKNTPVSACGFELSVAPTVRIIAALGIANFTNYINTGELKHMVLSAPYSFFLEAY